MIEIARAEIELAQAQFSIARRHSTIAFEASNHYYYRPLDLAEKILNCRQVIDDFQGPEAGRSSDLLSPVDAHTAGWRPPPSASAFACRLACANPRRRTRSRRWLARPQRGFGESPSAETPDRPRPGGDTSSPARGDKHLARSRQAEDGVHHGGHSGLHGSRVAVVEGDGLLAVIHADSVSDPAPQQIQDRGAPRALGWSGPNRPPACPASESPEPDHGLPGSPDTAW